MNNSTNNSEKTFKKARLEKDNAINKTDRVQHISSIVLNLFKDESSADVKLVSGNTEVPGHRCILSSVPYFKAMFQSNMKESKSDKINLTETIPEEFLQDIIEYIYCGTIRINAENIIALLHISQQLMLEDLLDSVCLELSKNIQVENCLLVLQEMNKFLGLINRAHYKSARAHVSTFAVLNLPHLMKTTEFHKLPINTLNRLMREPEHPDQRVVFEALIKWLEHNPPQFQRYLHDWLTKTVKLEKLPYNYLEKTVMNHPMLLLQGENTTNPFSDLVCNALLYQIKENKLNREAYKVSLEEIIAINF